MIYEVSYNIWQKQYVIDIQKIEKGETFYWLIYTKLSLLVTQIQGMRKTDHPGGHYWDYYQGTLSEHIEAETKWPSFSRRHFQMHFLNENVLTSIKI